VFALSDSLLLKKNAEPFSSFVPDLVTTAIAAPPAMPVSASKLFVTMLTVSIVSAEATMPAWWGSQMLMLAAPSMRVLLLFGLVPLTNVRSDRWGVDPVEFWKVPGVAPGTRFISV
jgi:hypothetical protein